MPLLMIDEIVYHGVHRKILHTFLNNSVPLLFILNHTHVNNTIAIVF